MGKLDPESGQGERKRIGIRKEGGTFRIVIHPIAGTTRMNRSITTSRHGISWIGASLLLFLLGCSTGPVLQPASEAEIKTHGPTAEAAAVVVSAQTGEWEGRPREIDGYTPLRVHIENTGDHPVRVQYADFRLSAEDSTVSPVDPRSIEGTGYIRSSARGYAGGSPYNSRNFRVASHHRGLRSLDHGGHDIRHPFGHAFGYGLGHGFSRGFGHGLGHGFRPGGYYGYGRYASRALELPTRDMLLTAVLEGVLEPDGTLDGVLYFPVTAPPSAENRTETSVPLDVTVVHSKMEKTLGHLSIPFVYGS